MKNKNQDTESIYISKSKFLLLRKILQNVHENLGKVIQLLDSGPEEISDFDDMMIGVSQSLGAASRELELVGDERVIEGVFDGEKMIANDGQEYSIPSNYASKSKLVEGDILKLTINSRGDFLYKQIGPVERQKIVGKLGIDKSGDYFVSADKKKWKVISASVTYFKGQPGDEVVILVPQDSVSKWAAVENVVKK
ncbi:MAG: hypothetical protein NTZ49_03925 [Candidatus Parcubacteria bacterium]|nr:hypothetical protein [Candidatus Parcubacteria bacterium]